MLGFTVKLSIPACDSTVGRLVFGLSMLLLSILNNCR